ncbi:SdpI family protein [Cryobacterium lactosi]|uniref:SdpI family protein n=1 Tax=Cryobacterium lactosi TaxID=1259202 RepID=A0A4R9BYC9_9MICO|nr:SdpI family protein [Cryobacterium lactosi]TFD93491.1 SdpI family protein [Cryobacterium lactosi]
MIISGIIFVLGGILVVAVNEAAARGRLGVNSVAGIRTRAVMMSEAAWTAGHRAARIPMGLAGLVMVLTGAAILLLRLDGDTIGPLVLASAAAAVLLVLVGATMATPAANRALVHSEEDERH